MAKGNSYAAEETAAGPVLEVVEGESAEVQPEEITALLDEMARQNAEQVAAEDEAAAKSVASESGIEVQDKAATDGPSDAPAADMPPQTGMPDSGAEQTNPASEAAEQANDMADATPTEPPVDESAGEATEPDVGPSFTMEDVMRAASESTSFSVDEIAQFESQPHEVAEPGEAPDEPAAEVEEQFFAAPERTFAASSDNDEMWAAPAGSAEKEGRDPVSKASPKGRFGALIPRLKSWAAWGLGPVATAVVFFVVAARMGSIESNAAGRDRELKAALAEVTESIDSLNERFGMLDKAQSERARLAVNTGANHAGGQKAEAKDRPSTETGHHDSGGHKEKPAAAKQGNDAPDSQHKPEHQTGHKVPVSSHAPKPAIDGGNTKTAAKDHFDPVAQVEGFQPAAGSNGATKIHSRLLAMKGGVRSIRNKPASTPVRKNSPWGTIKVWLDGKPVTRR